MGCQSATMPSGVLSEPRLVNDAFIGILFIDWTILTGETGSQSTASKFKMHWTRLEREGQAPRQHLAIVRPYIVEQAVNLSLPVREF